jgi:hypothetical protein
LAFTCQLFFLANSMLVSPLDNLIQNLNILKTLLKLLNSQIDEVTRILKKDMDKER